VGDLIDSLRHAGGEVRSGCPVESVRLADAPAILVRGPIIDPSILDLHSYVTEPMQAGRLLAYYRSGTSDRLDAYSSIRLPMVWQAVEFSHWLLQLLLASQGEMEQVALDEALRDARLMRLVSHERFASLWPMSASIRNGGVGAAAARTP
jgi:hypothetical protein